VFSAASRSKGPVSIAMDFMWDLRLKYWHRDPTLALRNSLSVSWKGMTVNTVAMYYWKIYFPSFHLIFTCNLQGCW